MRTVVLLYPPPADFEELLDRRRRTGADRHDEVWEGVLHMAPAPNLRHAALQAQLLELLGPYARARSLIAVGDFNLGQADDYRVPDAGVHHGKTHGLYSPTAALVVEILSPGDATAQKVPFYAARLVDELVIVDPDGHTVQWLALDAGEAGAAQPRARRRGAEAGGSDRLARLTVGRPCPGRGGAATPLPGSSARS